MRALIVRPTGNRRGLHDYSGAFLPESRRCFDWFASRGWNVGYVEVGERDPIDPVLEGIADLNARQLALGFGPALPLDRLLIFCHGGARALYLGGLRVTRAPGSPFVRLVDALERHGSAALSVTLYACSAGGGDGPGGDGCFADELRDRFVVQAGRSLRVDAHSTKGHTTRNPYVRRFEGELAGVGGSWLVRPGSQLWPVWRRALRADLRRVHGLDDLRWSFSEHDAWELHSGLKLGGDPIV